MSLPREMSVPFGLRVQKGQLNDWTAINKFGYNAAVGATEETIWSPGGNITYISTAGTAAVTSSNTGADNGGTVKVDGLDANYNEVSETITIGQTGTQAFFRVHRATLVTANTGTSNSGNITVTVDSQTAAYIPSGYAQSLQCNYTVPAGHTAYLMQVDIGVDEKEKPIHTVIKTRDNTVTNAAFQTKLYMVIESNWVTQPLQVPNVIDEKTDIELRASSPDGTLEVSGGFELVINKK